MDDARTIDAVRLQDTLDEVASTVAWAADFLEVLREDERGPDLSDLPGLRAELERLRLVADALVPGRVRDATSERRWFLAPDDAQARVRELESRLDAADRAVAEAFASQDRAREEAGRAERAREERHAREAAERAERDARARALVSTFLRDNGPATAAVIATGTGLSSWAVDRAAKGIARRGRDRRYVLEEQTGEPARRPSQP